MLIAQLEIVEDFEVVDRLDVILPEVKRRFVGGFEYVSFEEEDQLATLGLAGDLLQPQD
jgi:hypothetical protein